MWILVVVGITAPLRGTHGVYAVFGTHEVTSALHCLYLDVQLGIRSSRFRVCSLRRSVKAVAFTFATTFGRLRNLA